jgi:hypothetical protein
MVEKEEHRERESKDIGNGAETELKEERLNATRQSK